MNKNILTSEIQQFIEQNLFQDVFKIILKGSPFPKVSIKELANQIVCKEKAKAKLPTWFASNKVYYPSKVSLEQTSSEKTAYFKSQLLRGNKIIDLTGGFGVDAFYFSKVFNQVLHCELREELSEIVKHNYKALGVENIKTIPKNGIEYLEEAAEKYDCIYLDPSRRDQYDNKVFFLQDCLPNVPDNLDLLFSKSDTILIKTSPILDITSALKELEFTKSIIVVAVNNEVKELLFLLQKNYKGSIAVRTVNLKNKSSQFFNFKYNAAFIARYSKPLSYLYEPNAAILKSGGFSAISDQLDIYKLHQHSHLYTSSRLVDFPGRIFKINTLLFYDAKNIRKQVRTGKANITVRNFPLSVQQIRKETKLKDGGAIYLFFTKNLEDKNIVLFCEKV